ncbi:MAG: DUF4919 domain-containing protein [Bacteroidaceae bacterium]|nr:DUF4919 domain-containing protein [Bacteroidaceae bacterium]MBQ8542280.1 DUF4919 domain-containing protein [Bacteroidaceae bacterium]
MKKLMTFVALFATIITASAQVDYNNIKEIVENEKEYYNDILRIYQNDDPMIRVDDYALVYYGHTFTPQYKGAGDENEEALKNYAASGDMLKQYETAKKILEYNPVSLNALFYAWRAADHLIKPEEETQSYIKKYLGLLNMITTLGNGKSSNTPYRVITPDDQDHILYGVLDVNEITSREFEKASLCNIVTIEPTTKFQSRKVFFDISRYLSHTAKENK